jgi:calcyclin binding protein
MESEQAQALRLAAMATYPALKSTLEAYASNLPPPAAIVDSSSVSNAPLKTEEENIANAVSDVNVTAAQPKAVARGAVRPAGLKYVSLEDFSWDEGGYDSKTVTVYVDLEGVGTVKDNVTCDFKNDSFDLQVHDLNGLNYRLVKDNLEKDIVPGESRFVVKRNKIVIKLAKVKGEYSYEHWGKLTSKKSREQKQARKKDPTGGIMDMMKDMYDEGDDNMKKIIGEAMLKSQRGEKPDAPDLSGGGMPDLGGMGMPKL